MSPIRSLLLAFGCATALSSCGLFKKETPPAEDPYAAANPYASGAATAQNQGYPAAGNSNAGAYDPNNPYGQPAAVGYAQPNYNQPYTQPPAGSGYAANPGTGFAGGSGSPNAGANYGAASGGGRTHSVTSGDTLSGIGRRYGVSVEALMRANNLNTTLIKQGESLNIP